MKLSLFTRLLFLVPLLWADGGSATPCASTDYDLTSQAEVDALGETGCTSVSGYLYIEGESDITNLDGLASITSIGTWLDIRESDALTNLEGLANITSVGSSVFIYRNTSLTGLEGLRNLVSIGDQLEIEQNAALKNLDGLRNLTSIGDGGYLTIMDNGALTNIDGLANLTYIGGILRISGNNALTNLDGLANITGIAGFLEIFNNPALTNIDGLAKLTSVAAYLSIYDNSALTNCQGIATVLGLPNGPPDDNVGGDITVANNASGCNSIGQILEAYSYSLPEINFLALLTTTQEILGIFEATSTPPEEVLQDYKAPREAAEGAKQPEEVKPTPIPTLPTYALLILSGLMGLFGVRRLGG